MWPSAIEDFVAVVILMVITVMMVLADAFRCLM